MGGCIDVRVGCACNEQRLTLNIMETESRARAEITRRHQRCAKEPVQADDRPPCVPLRDHLRRGDSQRAVATLSGAGWWRSRRFLRPAPQPHHAPQQSVIDATSGAATLQASTTQVEVEGRRC
jgi:hypothetical protein